MARSQDRSSGSWTLGSTSVMNKPGTGNGELGTAPPARWVDGRGVRWVADADRLPHLRLVADRLADPTVRPVREIPSRAHFRLPPAEPGRAGTFIKHYRLLGWPRRLRYLLRPVPAAVEYRVARALAPHGLAAVVPWAWGVRLIRGIPVECYLVADDLGELITLEEWIPRHRHLRGYEFRGAVASLARALRRMHGLGYFHGDPHQRNIVPVQDAAGRPPGEGAGNPQWAFLDFQQARRARLTAPYRRLRDLGRVFHGVRLDLGRFQRAHLLRAYLGPGARLPRRLFRLLEAITLYYEFRLLRRRACRCLTVTENFRRSQHGPLEVWHVADVDAERIAGWLRNRKGPEESAFAVTHQKSPLPTKGGEGRGEGGQDTEGSSRSTPSPVPSPSREREDDGQSSYFCDSTLGGFHQEAPRRLLLPDGLPGVPAAEEDAADRLPRQPVSFLEMGDRLGVQAAALQHADAVPGLLEGAAQRFARPVRLPRSLLQALLQELDGDPNIFEGIDDPQEGGHGHHLRRVQPDADAAGIRPGQGAPGGGVVEGGAIVEGHGPFDGLHGVVVEEGAGVRRLHQGRRVEGAVARPAQPIVPRDQFGGETGRLVRKVLDPRIEVGVADVAPPRNSPWRRR